MKFFLVVVICMWGQCENYLVTYPSFTHREECRKYSETVVKKIRENLPDSSGITYCFDEKEVQEITNNLLKQEKEKFNPNI
jgi:hypothetical protein